MHDPMVVAFEVRRPWPTWSREKVKPGQARWKWDRHGAWWKPGSWSPFITAFGRRWYLPSLVTVWHVEPGGADSGQVCKHYDRWQDDAGKWHTRWRRGWRWHVHHWQVTIRPLQHLRARLFDRCALCGRKGRPNHSHQWEGKKLGWWKFRSRPGLYHRECSALVSMQSAKVEHELIHRQALAALALAWDIPVEDVPRRLFAGSDGYSATREGPGDFNLRYRLDKLIAAGAGEGGS
jgi:hypothetical protein